MGDAASVVGAFVVLRGLAFVGDALAHGVLPGIAAAVLLGVSSMIGALAGGIVMMVGVTAITRRTRLSGDTAIGLLLLHTVASTLVLRMAQGVANAMFYGAATANRKILFVQALPAAIAIALLTLA